MTPNDMEIFAARMDVIRANLSAATTGGNFRAYTVLKESDLINVPATPPALAFVLEEGEFFFLHGPEFWFGNVGTAAKGYNDRERPRWIKAPYSGMRALILASGVATIANEARLALSRIVNAGPYEFNQVYNRYGSSYWIAIENILEIIRNTTFLELNTGTDITDGELLYDVQDGDILLDNEIYCVQERTIATDSPKRLLGYPIEKAGTIPLQVTTPGIQLQYKEAKTSIAATHSNRIGYAVTSYTVAKGVTSFPVDVFPNSLPKLKLNSEIKVWKDIQKKHEVTRQGQTWEYTTSRFVAPTVNDPGNWAFEGGTWAALPVDQPYIRVTDISWNNPGEDWPTGAEVTITLAEPCPIPLICGQTIVCREPQPYLSAVAPVKSAFSFDPIGAYGGYMGSTTIQGRIRAQTKGAKLGHAGPAPVPANTKIDLYDPASENWGSGFPESQGLKHHSPARGMKIGDYVRTEDNDTMFRVNRVSKNILENPWSMNLNKTTHPLEPYFVNIYGIYIGGKYWFFPAVDKPRNPLYFAPVLPHPVIPYGKFPMLVEGMEGSVMKMAGPIPIEIPAGTRIDLYPAKDTDNVSYAYYDQWEYMHKLETYNTATFDFTKDVIWKCISSLDDLGQVLQRAKTTAEHRAYGVWMNPPYYKLKTLASLYWDSRLDVLIEDEANPDKYGEAFRVYTERRTALLSLYNTNRPSAMQKEYLSILDYHRRGLG